MIKLLPCVLLFMLLACGGSVPEEQRKQMREKMEKNKILRVTEAEIMEAAFAEGRNIVAKLDRLDSDSLRLRSFLKEHEGRINFLKPGSSTAHLLEQQLIDAYLADASGTFQDNVQEVRDEDGRVDTLLYTKPVTRKLPDGREELLGVWNIWLPTKELILEIGRSR